MDTSLIQGLFTFMTNNIFAIIYIFALIEIYLVISIFVMMKRHQKVMFDACNNLVKGIDEAPDHDSLQSAHERIESVLDFTLTSLAKNEVSEKIRRNATHVGRRPLYMRHYQLEMFSSLMSTLVQVFPLLGILGTILAIAQSAFQNKGMVDVSSLSNAFVLAMDTTILGITFSIIFMVIESSFGPKIDRVLDESTQYKGIIANLKTRGIL